MNNHNTDKSVVSQSDSLGNFLRLVSKRKRLIFLVFLTIVAVVTVGSFLMPPVYRAFAKILIEREDTQERALLFRMSLPLSQDGFDWIKSETEILTSYPVIARVIRELGLDKEKMKKNAFIFEKAVKRFRKKFKVESARNSNVVEVSYESRDPKLAAAVVERVLATYQKYRSELYNESYAYQFFEEQMRLADEKLRQLEDRLAKFKNREELVSPEFQGEILLTKLSDYERSLTAVQTRIIGKKAKLSVIMEQLERGGELTIPSTEVSNSLSHEKYIAKLKGELLDMEIQKNRLLHRFNPAYEGVVELEKQIVSTKGIIRREIQQIIEQEKTAIRALVAERQALQKSINRISQNIKRFSQKEYEFSQLNRGIDDNQEVYSMLLKQREEARISLAKFEKGVKVKIISPAVVPQKPIKPRKRLNIALSVMLGLMCGFGLAYFLEYYEQSIRAAEQLEEIAGLPAVEKVNSSERNFKDGFRSVSEGILE